MLLCQAEKILKSCFNPDLIVGVSRGGWVPARVLSDLLENRNLTDARVESYSSLDNHVDAPSLTQTVFPCVTGKRVLIVDDVADSGSSLNLVKGHVLGKDAKEAKIATLYYKPWSTVKPDYYEKQTKRWIVFPWDMKETIRKLHKDCGNASMEEETLKLAESGLPKQLASRFLREVSVEKNAETCSRI